MIKKTVHYLFSNRHRGLKLAVTGLTIAALGLYSVTTGPETEITLSEITSSPTPYRNLVIPFNGRIKRSDPGITFLWDRGMKIQVLNVDPSIASSEVISGQAKVVQIATSPPILRAIALHHHKNRNLKIYSGVLVLVVLFFLFLKGYRFNSKQLAWQRRNFDA